MKIPVRWITSAVIAYMALAFFWWAIHLWKENDEMFALKRELLELRFTRNNQGLNETQFLQTTEYLKIEDKWKKRRFMVIGEGMFFIICLAFGLFSINRTANREVALARQRRNFMLSITHELKSPIASLRLILETIGKRNLEREQLDKMAGNGMREAVRLQNLVESLLLAARLEDNWRPLLEPVDLSTLVKEAITALQMRFPEVRFETQLPQDLIPINADKTGLTSVIINLLENAAKYASEDPVITVSARQQGRQVSLSVADNGRGIPDAEKKAVFEKFYRIGNEEVRHTTGTGLGLYIVHQVVKAHGGTIQLADNKPKGTIFTVTL